MSNTYHKVAQSGPFLVLTNKTDKDTYITAQAVVSFKEEEEGLMVITLINGVTIELHNTRLNEIWNIIHRARRFA